MRIITVVGSRHRCCICIVDRLVNKREEEEKKSRRIERERKEKKIIFVDDQMYNRASSRNEVFDDVGGEE